MQKAELEAKLRESKKKSDITSLKANGQIPAIVYGKKAGTTPVSVDILKLEKMIGGQAGKNVIISLKIHAGDKSKTVPVLTKAIQRDPLTSKVIHVDFLAIDMEQKIKAKVPMELTGIPTGVKDDGGILVHGLRQIEVKCLPTDIPEKFVLDVSSLKINETRHVSDLKELKDVEIVTAKEETLVHISPPAKEEELAPQPTVSAAEVPSEKGAPLPGEAVPAEGKKGEKAEKGAAAPAAGKGPEAGKGASTAAPGAKPGSPAAKPGAPAGKPEEKKK